MKIDMRMKSPSHPGVFIRAEIIEPLRLTVTDAAKILGVTRPALSNLLNGNASLSPEMALRIEKAFGPKMDTLLRMQISFEIAKQRRQESKIQIKRYVPAS
jgi:addiction module HigA family antidote